MTYPMLVFVYLLLVLAVAGLAYRYTKGTDEQKQFACYQAALLVTFGIPMVLLMLLFFEFPEWVMKKVDKAMGWNLEEEGRKK